MSNPEKIRSTPDFERDRERISRRIAEHLERLAKLVDEQERVAFREFISFQSLSHNIIPLEDHAEDRCVHIGFEPDYEDELYERIFSRQKPKPFYHYTTLDTALKMLSGSEIWLGSIAGLNDRAELTFADSLLGDKGNPYTKARIDSANERFLFSCSEQRDHLDMWRLYGDDGRGACLEFQFEPSYFPAFYFALGKVMYGNRLITVLKKLIKDLEKSYGYIISFRRLFLWRNFVKQADWEKEKEVRLLFFNNPKRGKKKGQFWMLNKYGIPNAYVKFPCPDREFPLSINGIILGPKVAEPELSKLQIETFLVSTGKSTIQVVLSKKTYYR